jgi:hypothetical protein
MGFFGKLFEKKICDICGGEIGLLGNRKLEDGNLCKTCAKKLSPWFDDRRHSTVEQIRQQLVYREENENALRTFQVTRTLGDYYKMYIEEVNGVPTRFFVTNERDYMAANPDIIEFRNVVSCVTDINERREEIKRRTDSGELVSYHPPRYKYHYQFYIEMDLRDSPYFDRIRFNVNSGAVTIEMNGSGNGVAGLLGMNKRSVLSGISPASIGDHRRYNEYEQMCQKIEQIVEDGKRGGQNVGINTPAAMLEQIRNAPDMETVMTLCTNVAMLTANAPDKETWKQKVASAMADAQMRLSSAAVNMAPAEDAQPAVSTPVAPKFCSACGAKYEGGKFCQYCGTPF